MFKAKQFKELLHFRMLLSLQTIENKEAGSIHYSQICTNFVQFIYQVFYRVVSVETYNVSIVSCFCTIFDALKHLKLRNFYYYNVGKRGPKIRNFKN